jgi:DNA-binding transcriptional LysR family regulator
MNIELRHLRYFVSVAENLHFARAAEQLGISQPPLSQQIQALERELGVRLFERTNRRVELTEAGRLFLNEARLALQQVERAATIADRASRGEVGEVKVGYFGSMPFTLISQKILYAFRALYPDVHLDLQEMLSFQQIAPIMDGRLSLGFVRAIPKLPQPLCARELFRESFIVIMRKDHPLALTAENDAVGMKSLASEPFVFYPRSIGAGLYDHVISLCRDAGFSPRIGQEAGGAPTVIGLVAAGLGVSILPASMARVKMEDVVFRPLATKSTTAVWLAYRRDQRAPCTLAFIDVAVKEAGGNIPVIEGSGSQE